MGERAMGRLWAKRCERAGRIMFGPTAGVHPPEPLPGARIAARRTTLVASLMALVCALTFAAAALAAGSGPPINEAGPSVGGTARDGLRLKALKGSWSGQTPIVYTYAWRRCDAAGENCAAIAGAVNASYKATHQDVGHRFRVLVTATNAEGAASATSSASAIVAAAPPAKKAAPKVTGSAQDGRSMSTSNGVWKGTPPFTYSYRWEACNALGEACTVIPGATEATYRPVSSEIGGRLRAIVTATNSVGSASATSPATKRIIPGPPVSISAPSILGSLQDGQTLTAATGGWGGTGPFTYGYQWQRCSITGGSCQDIAGATAATYTLGAADLASKLVVVVTATSSLGSAAASSGETSPVAAVLPALNVLPTITGLLQDGQLLSIGTGTWSGTEPITFTYQWQLCDALGLSCSDIAGATGPSLKLSPADIAGVLDVVVTATNAAGSTSATSSVTGLIAGLLPSNTSLPSIGGLLQDGQLLSAVTGSWSGSEPLSFSYQWQQCNASGGACSDISGATGSTLSLISGLIGSTVDVVVTATNSSGSTSATTPVTSLITGLLPVNTALPSISGLLQDGQLLSAVTGSWSGSEPLSYTYQWQTCDSSGNSCSNISGATGSTFSLISGLVGSTLDVVVTATNAAGSTSATTPVTSLVAGLLPVNTALPSISGLLQDGQILSAVAGSWSGSEPISYSYQWQACNAVGGACSNISGATGSTLSLVSGLVGSTLDVVVTATNAAGSTSATTPVTSLISGLLPSNTALPSISGLLQDGQLLSAASGSWSGSEPISYSYQWQQCNASGKACANISGATGSTLSLVSGLVGSTLDVVVTATNSAGSTSATTPVTSLIAGLLPSNTALPSISGLLQDGQLLSAASGSWSGSAPISYSYQWQQCNASGKACSNISGATGSTLSLISGLVGSTLDVVVTATNSAGSTSATAPVSGLITGILPTNTTLPSIAGSLVDGQLLNVASGSWSGSAPISYSYQWQQCNASGKACSNISGATGSTLSLVSGLVGSTLDVVVTATNPAGSTSATTPVTSLVAGLLPSNTALPSISGLLQEGQSASVSTGTWTGSTPITYTYHWQECNGEGKACKEISGATGSTLGLVTALIGKTLEVVVTATNPAGSVSATTPVTGLVKGILPANTALPKITGLLKVGQVLTAATGTWTGTAPISFAYQWQLCELIDHTKCTNIAGATSSTFLLGLLDLGLPVRVVVTATNVAGATAVPSIATGLIEGLGLNPVAGPATGGTAVTLSAVGVSSATAVHFGGKEATEVEVVSPTEITAQAPPGSGTVPVTVSTSEGTTAETPADQYTYR
jgi:hypothetical protein